MADLAESLGAIRKRIRAAAARGGRKAEEITLVAASKGVGIEKIRRAMEEGVAVFGENKVQEAEAKFPAAELSKERSDSPGDGAATRGRAISLHLIGALQTNKVKRAVGFFDLIHSVDSLRLAEKIEQEAEKKGIRQPILVEVNVGGETSKRGAPMKEAPFLVEAIRKLRRLDLQGLMTLPPPTPDPEGARPYFSTLRKLGGELGLSRFSMGMSGDFEVAIEEGATWVRIGTAIFGPRG